MENGAPAVGRDAITVDRKLVRLDTAGKKRAAIPRFTVDQDTLS
jgi:hypothetical protein